MVNQEKCVDKDELKAYDKKWNIDIEYDANMLIKRKIKSSFLWICTFLLLTFAPK